MFRTSNGKPTKLRWLFFCWDGWFSIAEPKDFDHNLIRIFLTAMAVVIPMIDNGDRKPNFPFFIARNWKLPRSFFTPTFGFGVSFSLLVIKKKLGVQGLCSLFNFGGGKLEISWLFPFLEVLLVEPLKRRGGPGLNRTQRWFRGRPLIMNTAGNKGVKTPPGHFSSPAECIYCDNQIISNYEPLTSLPSEESENAKKQHFIGISSINIVDGSEIWRTSWALVLGCPW